MHGCWGCCASPQPQLRPLLQQRHCSWQTPGQGPPSLLEVLGTLPCQSPSSENYAQRSQQAADFVLLPLQHHTARSEPQATAWYSCIFYASAAQHCRGRLVGWVRIYTFPAAAVVITWKAMLHAHSCAAGFAVVCVDARELLLAPWNRALELSVHPGIIAGVTILREHNAA